MHVAPSSTIDQTADPLNIAAAGRQRLSMASKSTGQANSMLANAASTASDHVQRLNARIRSGETNLGFSFANTNAAMVTSEKTKMAKPIIFWGWPFRYR